MGTPATYHLHSSRVKLYKQTDRERFLECTFCNVSRVVLLPQFGDIDEWTPLNDNRIRMHKRHQDMLIEC